MKRLLILTALIPFAALAQPLNTMNNPNQQGYVIPSQQRMQTEMMSQQQQQKGMLNQQLKTQTQMQPAKPAKSDERQHPARAAGADARAAAAE
ncbi:protein YhhA [Enterobacter asburiae]|uniref:Protein YhhA n=1 Tax=Enterobacter asburiae TaxID=61645 RepID=A0A376FGE6_ENTAS|nr:protein YhhA [Enterobacter asburiae]